MNNKELLRCPFCGGEAVVMGCDDDCRFDMVVCLKCGLKAKWYHDYKEEAINHWNTRNYLEKQDSSNVEQSVQVPEVVENGSCKYLPDECCKKSYKEENATCKKSLQLSRSDIEKTLKPIEEIPLFNEYINRGGFTESDCFSLDELKPIFKHWIVNLICSALRIEE